MGCAVVRAGDGALLTMASRSAPAEGSGESLLAGNRSTSGGQVVWEEISSTSEVVDSCGVLSLGVGIGGYSTSGERTSELRGGMTEMQRRVGIKKKLTKSNRNESRGWDGLD